MNFKLLNTIISIFYAHRGLSLREIFLLGVVFAITNLLFEIPSSYAADKWGRKKTIAVAVVFLLLSSVCDYFAHSFLFFVMDLACYALSYSFMTGTDDALIYDTARELGQEKNSAKELGNYYSAQRFFKIVTPLMAVAIASGMLEWQFKTIIVIEFVTTMAALPFVWRIVEPVHKMEVEKVEAGIILDAWNLIRNDWDLIRMILNRTIMFTASFLIWRIHQEYFLSIGVPVWTLGIMWALLHLALYVGNRKIDGILPRFSAEQKINALNTIFVLGAIAFTIFAFEGANKWLLIASFSIFTVAETARWSLFSDLFNKRSKSYNRATTLSLTNLLKSFFDVPLALGAAAIVAFGPPYVFLFVTTIAVAIAIFMPVKKTRV